MQLYLFHFHSHKVLHYMTIFDNLQSDFSILEDIWEVSKILLLQIMWQWIFSHITPHVRVFHELVNISQKWNCWVVKYKHLNCAIQTVLQTFSTYLCPKQQHMTVPDSVRFSILSNPIGMKWYLIFNSTSLIISEDDHLNVGVMIIQFSSSISCLHVLPYSVLYCLSY